MFGFGNPKVTDPYNTMGNAGGTTRRTAQSPPMKVTPGQFRAMTRAERRTFLRDPATSARVAEAAGVAATCGGCGEPFMTGQRTDNHRCDPAHHAELARENRQGG